MRESGQLLLVGLTGVAIGLPLACNAVSGVGDYSFDGAGPTTTGAGQGGSSSTSTTSTSGGMGGGTSTGATSTGAGGGLGGDGGSGGAPPTWQVVETLTVPVDCSSVSSTTVLELSGTYRLRASGTANLNTNANWIGDAEYFDFSDVPTSLRDVTTTVDMGLAVDDDTVDLDRNPRWGDYDPTHVYEVDYDATGAVITASFHDSYCTDNAGSLTLEILSWQ